MGKPRQIPRQVREAQIRGDYVALSNLGRAGAQKKRSNRTSREKRRIAILKAGILQNRFQALEHISDPNREAVEYRRVITSA